MVLSILVADDHEAMRRGVRDVLEEQPGWSVCGEAADGRAAVDLARAHRPQVVVLDLGMPGLNGVEATRRIRSELPDTEVLVFTGSETEALAHDALAAGAHAIVLKAEPTAELLRAVTALGDRSTYYSPRLRSAAHDREPRRARAAVRGPVLTAREREVVQLVAEGRSSAGVAAVLGISEKTVETHRANVMTKLGLGSVADLVRYAVRNALVAP